MTTMLLKRMVEIGQHKGCDGSNGDDSGDKGGCMETAVILTTTG